MKSMQREEMVLSERRCGCKRDAMALAWDGRGLKGDPMVRYARNNEVSQSRKRDARSVRRNPNPQSQLRHHFTSRGRFIDDHLESRSVASCAHADHVRSSSLCAVGASHFGRGRRPIYVGDGARRRGGPHRPIYDRSA